jgi:hypothetical protein
MQLNLLIQAQFRMQAQFTILLLTIAVPNYLFWEYPFSMGGSFVLCLLIAVFMPIVYVFKELGSFIIITCLLICGILALNFMAWWEAVSNITMSYIILQHVIVYVIIMALVSLLEWLFIPQDQLDEARLSNLFKYRRVLLVPLFFMFGFSVFGSLLMFAIHRDAFDIYSNISVLKVHLVPAASLSLGCLISLVYLNKIDDALIGGLLSERVLDLKIFESLTGRKVDPKAINKGAIMKWYSIILAVIIIMGSVLETQRGLWLMWIETVLLLVLMASIFWRILKLKLE